MPTISIGMSFYKRVTWMDRCLDSLVPQIKDGDEIIVCEDGKSVPDDVRERIGMRVSDYMQLPEPHSRSRLWTVYNRLAAAAKGDILCITNQDMEFPPSFLERVRSKMQELDKNVVLLTFLATNDPGKYGPGSAGSAPNYETGFIFPMAADRQFVALWREKFLPFDEEFNQFEGYGGMEWALRMHRAGIKFWFESDIRCIHWNHPQNPESTMQPFGAMLFQMKSGHPLGAL
jgi:glycosyltransferase involved in cell wall biosynthesis